jgi:hypothetical protein
MAMAMGNHTMAKRQMVSINKWMKHIMGLDMWFNVRLTPKISDEKKGNPVRWA